MHIFLTPKEPKNPTLAFEDFGYIIVGSILTLIFESFIKDANYLHFVDEQSFHRFQLKVQQLYIHY